MTTLLLVSEDNHHLPKIMLPLEQEGYAVVSLMGTADLPTKMAALEPVVVLFNLEVEKQTARTLCQVVHEALPSTRIPILFIVPLHFSAQQVADVLDAGADDVLKRPFSPPELKARMRALLRRNIKTTHEDVVRLQLDSHTHSVQINHRVVELTPVEFELLNFLCKTRPTFHTAPDLLQRLWDYPPQGGDTALVRNHIRNLRLKLESDPDRPRVLVSQYGRGYSVRALVQQS